MLRVGSVILFTCTWSGARLWCTVLRNTAYPTLRKLLSTECIGEIFGHRAATEDIATALVTALYGAHKVEFSPFLAIALRVHAGPPMLRICPARKQVAQRLRPGAQHRLLCTLRTLLNEEQGVQGPYAVACIVLLAAGTRIASNWAISHEPAKACRGLCHAAHTFARAVVGGTASDGL
jgi:hypothetical protein